MNFMEEATSFGFEDLNKAILDAVDSWHNYAVTIPDDVDGYSIHLFLGMTWEEYGRWVEKPDQLADIVARRRLLNRMRETLTFIFKEGLDEDAAYRTSSKMGIKEIKLARQLYHDGDFEQILIDQLLEHVKDDKEYYK